MANNIYFGGMAYNKSSSACIVDLTTPTFAGITSVVANSDGSLLASWTLGTTSKPLLRYEVYLAIGTLTGSALFSTRNNITASFPESANQGRVFLLPDQATYLVKGTTYTIGVRAVDSLGYQDSNTAVETIVSTSSGNLVEVLQQTAQKTENAANLIMSTVL